MAKSKKKRERHEEKLVDAREQALKHAKGANSPVAKIPKGMESFKWSEEKTYNISVVGFIAGKGNPLADEGYQSPNRTVFVHKNLGAKGQARICNQQTHNKKCGGCDALKKIGRKLSKDEWKKLAPKEWQLFFLIDHDELEKGVQYFQTSYWMSFGEKLDEELKNLKEKDPRRNFHSITKGSMLEVRCKKGKYEGRSFIAPDKINIIPREEQFEIVDLNKKKRVIKFKVGDEEMEVPCMDDLVPVEDYKSLYNLLMQGGEDEEADDKDEDDDEMDNDESDDSDDESEEESEEDEEEEDEDDDEPKKKGKKSKKGGKKKKVEEEDEEEDEEDSDDDEDDDESEDEDDDEESSEEDEEDEDDEDSDEVDEEDDEDDEPKKKKGKVKKGKKKKSEDDDEDDDDLPF